MIPLPYPPVINLLNAMDSFSIVEIPGMILIIYDFGGVVIKLSYAYDRPW
jgi:hypothetical protein